MFSGSIMESVKRKEKDINLPLRYEGFGPLNPNEIKELMVGKMVRPKDSYTMNLMGNIEEIIAEKEVKRSRLISLLRENGVDNEFAIRIALFLLATNEPQEFTKEVVLEHIEEIKTSIEETLEIINNSDDSKLIKAVSSKIQKVKKQPKLKQVSGQTYEDFVDFTILSELVKYLPFLSKDDSSVILNEIQPYFLEKYGLDLTSWDMVNTYLSDKMSVDKKFYYCKSLKDEDMQFSTNQEVVKFIKTLSGEETIEEVRNILISDGKITLGNQFAKLPFDMKVRKLRLVPYDYSKDRYIVLLPQEDVVEGLKAVFLRSNIKKLRTHPPIPIDEYIKPMYINEILCDALVINELNATEYDEVHAFGGDIDFQQVKHESEVIFKNSGGVIEKVTYDTLDAI